MRVHVCLLIATLMACSEPPTAARDAVAPDAPPDMAAPEAPALSCGPGERACDGRCVDVSSDRANCGVCGRACSDTNASGAACVEGRCVVTCGDGWGDCDGSPYNGCEASLALPTRCGACGVSCAEPTPVCSRTTGGQYACASGCSGATPTRCGNVCVDTRRDASHCGGCDRACPATAHGRGVCASGACGLACDAGYHLCAGRCVNDGDVATCGGRCEPCEAAEHATATCDAARGACSFVCAEGFADCDGNAGNGCETDLRTTTGHCGSCGAACPVPAHASAACVDGVCGVRCDGGYARSGSDCVPVAPPRLIAPLSTATVTSRRPTLRWASVAGSDGARLQLCRDRACTTVIATIDATGRSARPVSDLPPGVVFWRAFSVVGGSVSPRASATWQFTVGARSAPVDTSWGTTLDVNGDGCADVVVGTMDAGRACLYLGSATGLATTPATTLAGPDGSNFGQSLASAGDVNGDGYGDLVIGARSALSNVGRAYLYLGGATGLATTPSTTLTGPDGVNSYFGSSVASAGDVNGDGYGDLAVAAPGFSAYLFLGSASGLVATPAMRLTDPDGSGFGGAISLASAGDINGDGYADLVIGAPGALGATGRVHLFLGSATGLVTTPAASLTGLDGAYGWFGGLIASESDVNGDGYADLVVGAPGALSDVGRAYLYLGGASGLAATPATTLTGPDGGSFGLSLARAGDVNGDGYADLVVGAPGALRNVGRAYLYLGDASGLAAAPATTLTGPDGGFFGQSVASSGDVNGDGYDDVVVGAYGVLEYTGRAYLYLGSVAGLVTTPATTLTRSNSDGFGRSATSVGDVNGDGYADLVVGAPYVFDHTGLAYLYLGSPGGFATTPATTLTGPDGVNCYFGIEVARAGDVNGDGYDDVIVVARVVARYVARLYLGSATGLATTPIAVLRPEGSDRGSVTSAGDVNRDGYDDVFIALSGGGGSVYLYLGGATGLATTPTMTLILPGYSVSSVSAASAGDVNGDGYADVVVGSWYSNSAYLYLGGAMGLATTPATTLAGPDSGLFGLSVAGAGDVNGDGYGDLVIGAPSALRNVGRAYLYLGSATGLATTPAASLTGVDGTDGGFGSSIASAGDVNADGYDDVIVGAPGALGARGRAHLYLGSSTGLVTTPSTTLTGPDGEHAGFSSVIADAGDVNGDRYADLIVGAPGAGPGNTGPVYLYLGSVTGLATTPTTRLTPPDGASGYYGWSVASVENTRGHADPARLRRSPRAPGTPRRWNRRSRERMLSCVASARALGFCSRQAAVHDRARAQTSSSVVEMVPPVGEGRWNDCPPS